MEINTATFLETAKYFLLTKGTEIGIALIKAALIWFIGKQIIKLINGAFSSIIVKNKIDLSLQIFLKSIVNNALLILLIMTVLTTLGVEMTSFLALIGAAGLAIGLALQGSLSNFAGGILILLIKPFKVGDVIEAQGVTASVTEIQIFHTVLKSFDNKTIIIPNGPLYNNIIINYSTEANRKVEWIFSVSYSDDIDKVKSIIKEVVFSDERILDKDTPYLVLSELADSAVNFKVRGLVKSEDYWDIYFEKQEAIKKAFDNNGISIPFPHSEVFFHQKP